MENKTFKHKKGFYGKTEMAEMYGVSRKTFIKWIEPYLDELQDAYYDSFQKGFTPRQAEIIFEKLGNPDKI